jgi:hypothetical protein
MHAARAGQVAHDPACATTQLCAVHEGLIHVIRTTALHAHSSHRDAGWARECSIYCMAQLCP